MALTLEQLFDAYTDESKDFATDIYEWFGLKWIDGVGGGIGAEEFKQKYSMYIPTYDTTAEEMLVQDQYLDYRNAAETQNLAKIATDRVYSEEMENLSTTMGQEIKGAKKIAGDIGLRSGTLEEALSDTLAGLTNKADALGSRYALQREANTNTYNAAIVDSTLDHEKGVHETKQDFYDRVMASVDKLVKQGAFDKKCPDNQPYWCERRDKCVYSAAYCTEGTDECDYGVDACGECRSTWGSGTWDISECEGFTDDGNSFLDPAKEEADCVSRCGTYNDMVTTGDSCVESCLEGGSQSFYVTLWYNDNYDDINYNSNCLDPPYDYENGTWICESDDPRTDEVEGDEECYGCSWKATQEPFGTTTKTVWKCGVASYDSGVHSFSDCPDGCCGDDH